MEQSLSSLLFVLLSAPLALGATTSDGGVVDALPTTTWGPFMNVSSTVTSQSSSDSSTLSSELSQSSTSITVTSTGSSTSGTLSSSSSGSFSSSSGSSDSLSRSSSGSASSGSSTSSDTIVTTTSETSQSSTVGATLSTTSESTTSDTQPSSTEHTVTSTTDEVTSTNTVPPTEFTASTLTETTISSNTWITTQNEDDETTILPVIIVGGKPIALWNLPNTPNVQFNFPNLPSFHLPCIRIFGQPVGNCPSEPVSDNSPDDPPDDPTDTPTDEPTDEPSSTTDEPSSTSSECSATSTVSQCEVNCAEMTTSNSCVSYTTTCSETQTGCSVTGATSTISTATSTSCSSCNTCFDKTEAGDGAPAGPTPPPPMDDDEEAVAKRMHARDLQRRDPASEVKTLGACALVTGAASSLTQPAWPSVKREMLTAEIQGNMDPKFETVSRYYRATVTGACSDVPTITKVEAAEFTNGAAYTNMANKPMNNNKDPSLDHAYEKSWLKSFLESIAGTATGGGKLSCDDINNFFFPKAPSPGTCQFNLLQPVWDSIGSNEHVEYFVAMSQFLNGDGKGRFFGPKPNPLPSVGANFKISSAGGWKWPTGRGREKSAIDALRKMMNEYWEWVLFGNLVMKSDPMLSLIDRTNNRIYDALLTVDANINAPENAEMFSDQGNWDTAFGSDGIAGAYKEYMERVVLPKITRPSGYLTNMWVNLIKGGIAESEKLPDVGTDPNDSSQPGQYYGEWQKFKKFADEVDSVYLRDGSYQWEYTFSFSWDRNNMKRQDDGEEGGEEGGALTCPFPSTTGSTSLATNSATSTASSTGSSTGSSTSASTSQTSGSTSQTSGSTSQTSGSTSETSGSTSASTSSEATSVSTSATTSSQTSAPTSDSTSSGSTTTSGVTSSTAPEVTAPAVTVGTDDEDVDKCEQGYGTYSLMAQVTAPANAVSQKFYIPSADTYRSSDWEVSFLDGFVGTVEEFDPENLMDPRIVIESWLVKTDADDAPLAEGDGGEDMKITWTSPDEANGTFVELTYVHPDGGALGEQEWGIVAQGGETACMPDHCNDPPEEFENDNGITCKKYPCSTQIVCEDTGEITPRAECLVIEDGIIFPLWYEVQIVTNNFVMDGGKSLKSEQKGCGAMTGWEQEDINIDSPDGEWTAVNEFWFTLPITIAGGCVERAIASAGGPEGIECANTSSDWIFFKRGLSIPGWGRIL